MTVFLSLLSNLWDSIRCQSPMDGSFWMPQKVSTIAPKVDTVFYFIFWVSVVFFVIIAVTMTVFVFKYRRREGVGPQKSPSHSMALELTWSIIPLILVVIMFWMGFVTFVDMNTIPSNAYEVQVTGQRWNWMFTYPNGHVDEDLHVPVDTDIRLVMTSEDVIHSFFIPSFRIKKDVVPGRYTKAWFHATEPGEYVIFCAEYCGSQHSDMLAGCVVHKAGEFEKWLADASNFLDKFPPAEVGEMLYSRRGCKQCHKLDGKAAQGPSFLGDGDGIFGEEHEMKDGTTVIVDENYIRESILEPRTKIVDGYDPKMPTYKGKLSDKEITALIEFIKSQSKDYVAPPFIPPATGEAQEAEASDSGESAETEGAL